MSRTERSHSISHLEYRAGYNAMLADIISLLKNARRSTAKVINLVMTATYWELGRRIVEREQEGRLRSEYGSGLLKNLARDLTGRFGRGFSVDNLETMRQFYLAYPTGNAPGMASVAMTGPNSETLSRKFKNGAPVHGFVLPWSHYALLVRRCGHAEARTFYETEALRGGWSVRQLERQIDSQFYERTALSRNKAVPLAKGMEALPDEVVAPDEEIKDPLVLEFLDLKDGYSETELEHALIRELEAFLLELGGDFSFVGRQRRLRIGDEWYRIDLLFFNRRLRCLVVVDLKLGKFTHSDAGQMHLYLNYAREHWTRPGENPPVGLILCNHKDTVLAHYALDNLPNKVMAAEYRTALPNEKELAAQMNIARRRLSSKLPPNPNEGSTAARSRRLPDG